MPRRRRRRKEIIKSEEFESSPSQKDNPAIEQTGRRFDCSNILQFNYLQRYEISQGISKNVLKPPLNHGALQIKRSHWLARKLPHSTKIQVVFVWQSFLFYLQKHPSLLLNGEVIWQASDYSLTKELHGSSNQWLRGPLTETKLAKTVP